MKTQYYLLGGILVLLTIGVLLVAHSEPSTYALDKDLAEVHAAIEAVNAEAAQYSGGLILIQIQLQKSVLQNTEAMLLQKRKALLRRIELGYTIDGKKSAPATTEQLDKIQKDIQEVKSKIEKTEQEAAQYNGGLIQVTLLMSAETQKMTLAALEQKYYTAKYGIPFVSVDFDTAKDKKAVSPGKIVNDKDAL
ncbi:MAG TPA: hypothetical protein VFT64_01565 [Rickettsiales bacterium]|nr:hypothetical protein [Rickettsiales bacterium]